MYIYKYTV